MSALKKARIYDPESVDDGFYVQFNPNTLSYSVGANLNRQREDQNGGVWQGRMQADPTGQTGLATLSATLFFYTYESESSYQDVRIEVNRIRAFLRRGNDGNGVISRRVAFTWGTLTVEGTLESLSVSYQMFAADGTPVQAEVSITILGEDPDVTAEGIDHAASVELQKDAVASWRDLDDIPQTCAWLFT